MNQTWHQRVADYVDELQQIANAIDESLKQNSVDTGATNATEVEQSMQGLIESLTQLEQKIVEREQLLHDDEAPSSGVSLSEKLRSTGSTEDQQLAERCDQVAALISDANHSAISLFVCQFHLADFSQQLARLIAGAPPTSTYDPTAATETQGGGGLFNEVS